MSDLSSELAETALSMPKKKEYIRKAVIFVSESKERNIEFFQPQLGLGHTFIVFAGAEAEVQCVHLKSPVRCS
jgi:hypothetical protein